MHHIKNLLTGKQLLNGILLHYLPWWIVQTAVLMNAFCQVGRIIEDELWNERIGGPEGLKTTVLDPFKWGSENQ
jgi:hypothetical protein